MFGLQGDQAAAYALQLQQYAAAAAAQQQQAASSSASAIEQQLQLLAQLQQQQNAAASATAPATATSALAMMEAQPASGGRKPRVEHHNEYVGQFQGKVNDYDDDKGFGFIFSEAMKQLGYRKTVFVNRRHLGTCKPGDIVNFTMVLDDLKRPMAQDVTFLKAGCAVDFRLDQKGEDLGDYEGTISGVNEQGIQRIRCEKLVGEGWEWDAVVDRNEGVEYQFGDQVAFTAFETNTGRLRAKNVQLLESSYLGAFIGDVKSFNDSTGYGFIECDEIKILGYQDVFVHSKYGGCGNLAVGDKVSFQCFQSLKKQPQAKNVMIVESKKPQPVVVARPLAPEDQALAEALKRPLPVAFNTDYMKGKGKDKGKGKGKDKGKDEGDVYQKAGIPLGLALMMKRQKTSATTSQNTWQDSW